MKTKPLKRLQKIINLWFGEKNCRLDLKVIKINFYASRTILVRSWPPRVNQRFQENNLKRIITDFLFSCYTPYSKILSWNFCRNFSNILPQLISQNFWSEGEAMQVSGLIENPLYGKELRNRVNSCVEFPFKQPLSIFFESMML